VFAFVKPEPAFVKKKPQKSPPRRALLPRSGRGTEPEGTKARQTQGFNAVLKINCETETYDLTLYTKISISKNGNPFVLKKIDGSDIPRDAVQIN
jgi:hypothetical protein